MLWFALHIAHATPVAWSPMDELPGDPHPACGTHLEYYAADAWRPFVTDLHDHPFGLLDDLVPDVPVPRHDRVFNPIRCGSDPPEPPKLPWRMVTRSGHALVSFEGDYAVDVTAFMDLHETWVAHRRMLGDPACKPTPSHTCWTAFELWYFLVDWEDTHCVGGPTSMRFKGEITPGPPTIRP